MSPKSQKDAYKTSAWVRHNGKIRHPKTESISSVIHLSESSRSQPIALLYIFNQEGLKLMITIITPAKLWLKRIFSKILLNCNVSCLVLLVRPWRFLYPLELVLLCWNKTIIQPSSHSFFSLLLLEHSFMLCSGTNNKTAWNLAGEDSI